MSTENTSSIKKYLDLIGLGVVVEKLKQLIDTKLDKVNDSDNLNILDSEGNVIAKIDKDGLTTTDVIIGNTEDGFNSLSEHISIGTHITSEERANWNETKEKLDKLGPIVTTSTVWDTTDKTDKEDSIVFLEDKNQIWHKNCYYGNGFFIGTQEAYDAEYATGRIVNGTIVIIDDNCDLAILGTAILGNMILGKEK